MREMSPRGNRIFTGAVRVNLLLENVRSHHKENEALPSEHKLIRRGGGT